MKKSKGNRFNAKQFFINHGEKLGAGVIGLLAVMGLASASWGPESRMPEQLEVIAKKTKTAMDTSAWPEDKQLEFRKTPDVMELTRRMQAPNEDVEQFAPSVAFNEPINRLREKRAAVLVLPPLDPEQSVVSVPIALVDVLEEEEETEGDDPATPGSGRPGTETESEEDRERRERLGPAAGNMAGLGFGAAGGMPGAYAPPGLGAGGDAGGLGLAGAGLGMDPAAGLAGAGYAPPGMGMGGVAGMPGEMTTGDMYGGGYGDMYGGYGGMLGTAVPEKRIRYAAGVSVRYVFDLREQRKKIADALHIPVTDPRVAMYAEDFVDLQIERKQAIPALDPWSGNWEPLNSADVGEILEESIGSDLEIVNPMVTRPVITMALPRRAQGAWTKEIASHKRISEFVLSDEEKEIIRLRDEKLLKEAEERQARIPQRPEKKGFSQFKGSAADLMSSLGYGGGQEFNTGFIEGYGAEMGADPMATGMPGAGAPARMTKKQKEELEKLRKKLFEPDATNRLLLVRFIDFTVERGQQYTYRVRIVMNNPNFNMPVDDLEQPELATEKTITSDWSATTPPVMVPSDNRYYVTKVAASDQSEERADLSMYYEVIDKGTPVMADLSVPVGVRIGGEKEVELVDLSKSLLDRAKIDFRSRDLLCAVSEAPRLTSSEHPDLKAFLDRVPRGQRPVADQILVVNTSGSLIIRTAGDAAKEEQRDKGDVAFVIKEYEKIGWRRNNQVAGGVDPSNPFGSTGEAGMPGDMYGGYGSGLGMGYGDPLSSSGKGRSSRRSRSNSNRGIPGGAGRVD